MNLFHLAFDIALHAHMGQKDKQGQPYIFHPVAVANQFTDEDRQVVALLHDVVEDTDITLKTLSLSFPAHIVNAVDAITHRKGESNDDYILRCAKDAMATDVKRKDIAHNSGRLAGIGDAETIERLQRKYKRSLLLLNR